MKAKREVEQAEVAGARLGVQQGKQMGFSKIILECDAMNVVRTINQKLKGYSPLLLFYEDIGRMKNSFESFICNHVRRSGNTLAHLIARWNDVVIDHLWVDNFPQSFMALAGIDLL